MSHVPIGWVPGPTRYTSHVPIGWVPGPWRGRPPPPQKKKKKSVTPPKIFTDFIFYP